MNKQIVVFGFSAALLFIGAGCDLRSEPVAQIPAPAPEQPVVQEVEPEDAMLGVTTSVEIPTSFGWIINTPAGEQLATSTMRQPNLLYATKEGFVSTVFKKNLITGAQIKVFDFKEEKEAARSGNLWNGLPPGIALSKKQNEIAFVDNQGLKIFNLNTRTNRTLIKKVANAPETRGPASAVWSIKNLRAYHLARPLWSADDQFISFFQSHYEGASIGFVKVSDGQYFPTDLSGSYEGNIDWAPVGHTYVNAGWGGYERPGLHAGVAGLTTSSINLAEKFSNEEASFIEVNYSPDGQWFVLVEPGRGEYDAPPSLAIVKTNGESYESIVSSAHVSSPFFSPDNKAVYFVEKLTTGSSLLQRYDLSDKKIITVATLPEGFTKWVSPIWTPEGHLMVTAIRSTDGLVVGGDGVRLFMFDLAGQKVVYASQMFKQFVIFAGLLN